MLNANQLWGTWTVENSLNFDLTFKALTNHAPFPWQRRLFERLLAGELPGSVDLPTGLGKTAVMAIWLLARAAKAPLPRRLVYVVDRRAVVDQATDFAETLREQLKCPDLEQLRGALGLGDRPLPISTLRGQYVDNREWLEDPAAPAIIVGTVDMVGSRLLFGGFGVSWRMRPYHAGLMGCDTLVLLDEAHLSRPFERLLRIIEAERRSPPRDAADSAPGKFAGPRATVSIPPSFRVLPLSATLGSASGTQTPFALDHEDLADMTVHTRLVASKTLTIEDLDKSASIEDVLAERAWDLAQQEVEPSGGPVRVLVYCDKRTVAERVAEDLRKRVKSATLGSSVILFVGGRRVHERELAANELRAHGLLGDSPGNLAASVFLVATSAGEVGVDLDTDHMVCDLVAWERMVQRLGRVNRRGAGTARVLVIDQGPPEKKLAGEAGIARHVAVGALLADLPRVEDGCQAGPAALVGLCESSGPDRIAKASTPMPLYPVLTRALIDAWSMTSLREHSGRPEVDPWLRGWVDDDPQTTVVWRRCLPVRVDIGSAGSPAERLKDREIEEFFEAAPPYTAERLETQTSRVVEWLRKRTRKMALTLAQFRYDEHDLDVRNADDSTAAPVISGADLTAPLHRDAPVAFLLDSGCKADGVLSIREAASGLTTKDLFRRLAGRVLVVDARICGLNDGLLDASNGTPVPTADDNWGQSDTWNKAGQDRASADGVLEVRVRVMSDADRSRLVDERATRETPGQISDPWRESWAASYRVSVGEQPLSWLIVEKRRGGASEEDVRAVARVLQPLDEHQARAAEKAERIAVALRLPAEDLAMLVAVARHHDDGKRAPRWQRAFRAPRTGGPYAKTPGPLNRHVLNGYRHEFQSMLDVQEHGLDGVDQFDSRFELALHLLAAHHGHARPVIRIEGCDGLPPTAATSRANEVGRRFAKLQRQWGPWGLAWWEALLRAADQQASREPDEAALRGQWTPPESTSQTGLSESQSSQGTPPAGAIR